MKVTVQIVIDAQDGTPPAVEQVAVIARDDLTMASAGLALAEAHEVLSGIQHHLVTAQAVTAAAAGRDCASCGGARGRKDTRHIVLRTLFGTLRLESPRYKACPCAPGGPATVSPLAALLPERTTPELLLQEAKYAALTSYGAAATLLSEAFPLGRTLQPTAVRQQVESRRMVKKQQMRWSPRGAHLLLQVRTRVLNDDLAGDFARWYPGLAAPDQRQLVDAA